jgi:hypothetical protein
VITKRVIRDPVTERISEVREYWFTDEDVARQLLAGIHDEARHYEIVKRAVAEVHDLHVIVTVDPTSLHACPGGAPAVVHELAHLLRADTGLQARAGWVSITIRLASSESPAARTIPVPPTLGTLEPADSVAANGRPAPLVGFRP